MKCFFRFSSKYNIFLREKAQNPPKRQILRLVWCAFVDGFRGALYRAGVQGVYIS